MDQVVHERIPVTSVARTLVDLASLVEFRYLDSSVGDLQRSAVPGVRRLERALAEAERQKLLSWPALLAAVDAAGRSRGIRVLREVIGRFDPRVVETRSEAERLLLGICNASPGIPAPSMNVWIGGRLVDFVWTQQRLIAEADGRGSHADPVAFEDDRERDGTMLETDYRTVRFTYRMLAERPQWVARRLRRLLS